MWFYFEIKLIFLRNKRRSLLKGLLEREFVTPAQPKPPLRRLGYVKFISKG
jgi:hypothetical protein